MAKKSRTPPPPRPVQSPKQRGATRAPRTPEEQRRFRMMLLVGGSGFVALAVAIGIIAATRGGGGGGDVKTPTGLASALKAAGCTNRTFPGLTATHVNSLSAKVHYNSFPPTSGPHYYQPALWGMYDTPVAVVQAVHNLEHGGIVIEYGDKVPKAEIEKLAALYRESPNAMLVFPLPKLGSKIALTAWTGAPGANGKATTGHLAECTRFDENAFSAFREAFRGKARERFPLSQLTPGT